MKVNFLLSNLSFLFILFLLSACRKTPDSAYTNWAWYLGDEGTNQYSEMDQINKENVSKLEVAWTYNSGDADPQNRSQIQCNPLVIDGILYGTTPTLKLVALDAKTGEEIWRFNPFAENVFKSFGIGVNRGLAFWRKGNDSRILFAVSSFLFSVIRKPVSPIQTLGQME